MLPVLSRPCSEALPTGPAPWLDPGAANRAGLSAQEQNAKPRPQEAPPQASSAAPVVAGQGTRFQLPPSYAVQCLSSRTQSLQDVEELRGTLQAALIAAISELVWPGALEGKSLRL